MGAAPTRDRASDVSLLPQHALARDGRESAAQVEARLDGPRVDVRAVPAPVGSPEDRNAESVPEL